MLCLLQILKECKQITKKKNKYNIVMSTRKRKAISVKTGGDTQSLNSSKFANKLPDMNLKNPLNKLNVNDISPDAIMTTIENRNKLNLFPSASNLTDQISTISKAMTIKSAEEFGDFIGVNLSDKEEVNRYLREFKEALINPENTKETLEIIGVFAKRASLYLDASKPFLTPLIDTTVEQGSIAIEKFINSISTIIGNSIKEIPGVGLVFATAQGAEKVGEAGLAIVNASADFVKKSAETVEATKLNLEKTMETNQDQGETNQDQGENTNLYKNPIDASARGMSLDGKSFNPLFTGGKKEYIQYGGGIKVADRVRKSIKDFLTPSITFSRVKKMFMTRKHRVKKTKKTNKRR